LTGFFLNGHGDKDWEETEGEEEGKELRGRSKKKLERFIY
jgi:hypothetical protein